ncbi:MAG: hypothetical protein ACI4GY_06070 [Acutalibacteraceae bacterium]
MNKSQGNPVAAICAAATLVILEIAIRHCMKKYTKRSGGLKL